MSIETEATAHAETTRRLGEANAEINHLRAEVERLSGEIEGHRAAASIFAQDAKDQKRRAEKAEVAGANLMAEAFAVGRERDDARATLKRWKSAFSEELDEARAQAAALRAVVEHYVHIAGHIGGTSPTSGQIPESRAAIASDAGQTQPRDLDWHLEPGEEDP